MASHKKDMRRADLIVPYAEPTKKGDEADMSSTMASTLPMAAIFTRNKMIGWVAVVFAIQSWLAETPEQRKTSTSPAYFQVGMAAMSLLVLLVLVPPAPTWNGGQSVRDRGTGSSAIVEGVKRKWERTGLRWWLLVRAAMAHTVG
ncbi:hypothetical protein LEMA_P114490.1 [Plenodomus lingam JN3]|uniref:Uncharacterized protein n=1 Tax=Leptosphaeria maculans (strain JN3 / isolate v23.1.3 / race Av1-4-5-6-7-8) TaxID=985895 RepID=E4ZUF5_LEPMJ|nr:hypothetical protein LEMA_P114490.1 [Plenodomus lingam JN3]CBX95034.1 hypothetical protein LEMA_P114490.1 [Plenodomus lingam JN3]